MGKMCSEVASAASVSWKWNRGGGNMGARGDCVRETGRRKRLTKCQAAAVRVTVNERERMLDMEVGWQLKGR
ncbi:hypothetical protein CLV97_11134 [Planifilum fimeticola]|uniref:Uncharacterized protein n=1 Tax=Planifilum fimeticola TaxID=201975 RepID=A0A2T0LEW0_9BACL|nr:hypothetical protein [Planifilum fimeticola]PRX40692.1 hypothetical protein CLV97_11134 [Planifilum fimeticola]